MDRELNLGPMNGHAVGRVLKETVRRASVAIRTERMSFEAHSKSGYGGTMDDVFTSADRNAQEIYLRTFQECFPNCGVIGEEQSLHIHPRQDCKAYFTVDPLDGTKAFVRRQSHGVATMVALVNEGVVEAAYVGDINADEVYGYRPGSEKVHRISRLDSSETLPSAASDSRPISEVTALLRDPVADYSQASRDLIGKFESHEVMGSSIGTWAARLWKGEVGALFCTPGWETPWDSTPIVGISRKLGFEFYNHVDGAWKSFEPALVTKPTRRTEEMLIIAPHRMSAIF